MALCIFRDHEDADSAHRRGPMDGDHLMDATESNDLLVVHGDERCFPKLRKLADIPANGFLVDLVAKEFDELRQNF